MLNLKKRIIIRKTACMGPTTVDTEHLRPDWIPTDEAWNKWSESMCKILLKKLEKPSFLSKYTGE